MRLVIDMQGAQTASRDRGIGRYTLSLVRRLIQIAEHHEVILFINAALREGADALIAEFRQQLPRDHIVVFEPMAPLSFSTVGNRARVLAMETMREAMLVDLEPDVVLLTSLFEGYHDNASTSVGAYSNKIATAVIHYDLIPLAIPEYLSAASEAHFFQRKVEQLQSADLLLGISQASCDDAIERLDLIAGQVMNIGAAVEQEFCPDSDSSALARSCHLRLGINRAFVLYVPGGFDSRKNFERLFEAFSKLPASIRAEHQLVITGRLDHGRVELLWDTAAKYGLSQQELLLVGYVSDELLISLYRSAALFIFPSLNEGFGLPVLEAISCGAPTIASNTSSLPEVVGNAEALFDPTDVVAMSETIARGLTDTDYRHRLLASGRHQATQFSWERTAALALESLEALAARKPCTEQRTHIEHRLPARIAERLAALDPLLGEVSTEPLAECLAINLPLRRSRQFLIDVTALQQRDSKTGIQRVVRSLLIALMSEPPSGFVAAPVYYADDGRYRYANRFLEAFTGREAAPDELVDFGASDIYLGLDFNVTTTPMSEEVFRVLSRRGVRLCFVVYDMLPLLRPKWWPPEMSPKYERWLRTLASVADDICCISAAVADEVSEWVERTGITGLYAQPAVRHFHLGADLSNSAPSRGWPKGYEAVRAALDNGAPTFLMVGTIEPRKGHAEVLEAFDQLWAAGHAMNLVVVGKAGWMVDDTLARFQSHVRLGENFFWLEAASDECLEDLYQCATCLIAASEGEGFGLPLIEAARHGVPMIVREIPVFREVAGESAYYFGGPQCAGLAESVLDWLALYERSHAPSPGDMKWNTWAESAAQLVESLNLEGAQHTPACQAEKLC
jgi:glycosyltransferase involved in cell wall biosynthesis